MPLAVAFPLNPGETIVYQIDAMQSDKAGHLTLTNQRMVFTGRGLIVGIVNTTGVFMVNNIANFSYEKGVLLSTLHFHCGGREVLFSHVPTAEVERFTGALHAVMNGQQEEMDRYTQECIARNPSKVTQALTCLGCLGFILLCWFGCNVFQSACKKKPKILDSPPASVMQYRDPAPEYVVEKDHENYPDVWALEVCLSHAVDENRIREISDQITEKYRSRCEKNELTFNLENNVFAQVIYVKSTIATVDMVFHRKQEEARQQAERLAEEKRRQEEERRRAEEQKRQAEQELKEKKIKAEQEKKRQEKEASDRTATVSNVPMSVVVITTFDEGGAITRQERTSYTYGSDGIRVSALHEIDADADGIFESKKLTEYLNDSRNITGYSQVLRQTDYDADGNVVQTIRNIIGHARISQTIEKSGEIQEFYFTFDGHGSTRVLLDVAGAIAELNGIDQIFHYDAYGQAIGFVPSQAATEFLYSGEQFDAKIGQQYLRARYYDPATGRFNRLDPFFGNLNDPQSLHNYTYAHNDPVNGIDPNGEFLISLGLGMLSSSLARNQDAKASAGIGVRTISWLHKASKHWAFRIYDVLFSTQLLGSLAGVPTFWLMQGTLTAKVAAVYSLRGIIGATGVGQVYTRFTTKNAWHFTDDGSMMDSSKTSRYRFMYEYALKNGAKPGDAYFTPITINQWTDTNEKVNLSDRYWIGGLESFHVKGKYEIRILDNGMFVCRNTYLHWAGSDTVDAHEPWHPDAEENTRLWLLESAVSLIGDYGEGAYYDMWIHAFESQTQESQPRLYIPK